MSQTDILFNSLLYGFLSLTLNFNNFLQFAKYSYCHMFTLTFVIIDDGFPGIFIHGNMPRRCFASDDKRIIISTTWRSQQVHDKTKMHF